MADNAPHTNPDIIDGSTASFMDDVIQASMQKPVLVDFWATWCAPCKQLMPLLEKHVLAAGGKVKLVKIDIDKNQQLAAQLRVQSVPTVFAFFQGQPIDAFMGMMQDSQLKAFVDRMAKMAGTLPGELSEKELTSMLAQANDAFAENNLEHAAHIYQEILSQMPQQPAAMIGLVRLQLATGDVEGTKVSIDSLTDEMRAHKDFATLQAALNLAEQGQALSGAAEAEVAALAAKLAATPNDNQICFDLAIARHASGDVAGAIDNLLEIAARDMKWNDGAARQQLLTIFESLGTESSLARDARRRLSSLMFR